MFELFMDRVKSNQMKVISPSLPGIAQDFKRTLDNTIKYYRNSSFFVDNDHLLIRLIKTLPEPITNEPRRWYYQAEDIVDSLGEIFGIFDSRTLKVKPHQDLFFNTISEYLVSIRQPISTSLKLQDWLALDACKIIYHPFTDYRQRPMDGQYGQRPILGDYAVIGLDIPLLYVQYHIWLKLIAPKVYKAGSIPSMHNWVYRYPLTDMMRRYNDMSFFNRLYARINNIPVTSHNERAKVSLSTVDYTERLDVAIQSQVDLFANQKYGAQQLLNSMPMLLSNNALEFFHIDYQYFSRQMRWVHFIAKLDLYTLLIKDNTEGNERVYTDKWKAGISGIRGDMSAGFPSTRGIDLKFLELEKLLK
jgi:hypothetical protein